MNGRVLQIRKGIADILDQAADAIEKYGWIQGRPGDTEGGFSAYGALSYASKGNPTAAMAALTIDLTKIAGGSPTASVGGWNDTLGQTKEAVIKQLRSSAKYWRELKD